MAQHYNTIIIGAGTAGLTAALYTARSALSVLVVEEQLAGGQIIYAPDVENYPGIEKTSGFDFIQTLQKQAESFGAVMLNGTPENYRLDSQPKSITVNGEVYESDTVILANGVERRRLGCPGEDQFAGKGISYCATCDGSFFRGKTVCVVGGGNTAVEDALYLANLCEKVYLIHRRDEFRASPITVESAKKESKIEFILNSQVKQVHGEERVGSVTLVDKDKKETELVVSGVFVAVGLKPKNAVLGNGLQLTEDGYIQAGEDCKTNLPGVFTAGDTRNKQLRQLVTAAADGAVAASNAAVYIRELL